MNPAKDSQRKYVGATRMVTKLIIQIYLLFIHPPLRSADEKTTAREAETNHAINIQHVLLQLYVTLFLVSAEQHFTLPFSFSVVFFTVLPLMALNKLKRAESLSNRGV